MILQVRVYVRFCCKFSSRQKSKISYRRKTCPDSWCDYSCFSRKRHGSFKYSYGNTLYVSPEGNDDTNNGSENSPFATVSKTLSESGFSDLTTLGTVRLEVNISDSPELSLPDANLVVRQGKVMFRSGNAGELSLDDGELKFSNGKIGGAVNVSGGSLEVKGGTVEGKTAVLSGKLAVKNCSVKGNVTESSGGTVLVSESAMNGTLTLKCGITVNAMFRKQSECFGQKRWAERRRSRWKC